MERQHTPRWEDYQKHFRLLQRRIWQVGLALLLIGVVMEVLNVSRVSFLMLSVTIFIPMVGIVIAGGAILFLLLWPVLVALSGGGAIAWEKDAQTWMLLLITPIARIDLLLAKLVVGLSRQQRFIVTAMGLQLFPMLAITSQIGTMLRQERGPIPLLVMGLTILLFIYERMQVFVFSGLLGLLSSFIAGSWSLAMSGAVALGLLFVFVRTTFTYVIMVLLGGGKLIDTGPALFFGMTGIVTSGRTVWSGLAILIVLLALQEIFIELLSRWLVRRMGGG